MKQPYALVEVLSLRPQRYTKEREPAKGSLIFYIFFRLEVDTQVNGNLIGVGRQIIIISDIGYTKLISNFGIEHVVFYATTQFEAHVIVIQEVLISAFLGLLPCSIQIFCLTGNAVGEVGTNKRKNGNIIAGLNTVFNKNGNLQTGQV